MCVNLNEKNEQDKGQEERNSLTLEYELFVDFPILGVDLQCLEKRRRWF